MNMFLNLSYSTGIPFSSGSLLSVYWYPDSWVVAQTCPWSFCVLQVSVHRSNRNSSRLQLICGSCFLNYGIPNTIPCCPTFVISNCILSWWSPIIIDTGWVSCPTNPSTAVLPSANSSAYGSFFGYSGVLSQSAISFDMKFPVAPESNMAFTSLLFILTILWICLRSSWSVDSLSIWIFAIVVAQNSISRLSLFNTFLQIRYRSPISVNPNLSSW